MCQKVLERQILLDGHKLTRGDNILTLPHYHLVGSNLSIFVFFMNNHVDWVENPISLYTEVIHLQINV